MNDKDPAQTARDAGLLFLVALTHLGYGPLAELTGGGGLSHEQAWFYVLRGVEGAALWGIVLQHCTASPWRPVGLLACAWGVIEETQTAACGLADFGGTVATTGKGLCATLAGLPPYTAPIALAGLAWALTRRS